MPTFIASKIEHYKENRNFPSIDLENLINQVLIDKHLNFCDPSVCCQTCDANILTSRDEHECMPSLSNSAWSSSTSGLPVVLQAVDAADVCLVIVNGEEPITDQDMHHAITFFS